MLSARSFLVRGLLAGLVAGLAAFAVAFVVGEPPLNAAIAWEQAAGQGHGHPGHQVADEHHGGAVGPAGGTADQLVPRTLQSTAGLLTGTVVAGVALGGLVGVLSALALGRFGQLGARATALAVAAAGFVAVSVVPSWAYPPSPPGVGTAGTIGERTALYFLLMAISLIALAAAVLVGRSLAPRWGGWYASITAIVGYLVVVVVAVALLPTYDEVPAALSGQLLYEFRRASFLTQLTLWAVLGAVLADLAGRLIDRARVQPAPHPDAPAEVS